jgi:hypothetical protein
MIRLKREAKIAENPDLNPPFLQIRLLPQTRLARLLNRLPVFTGDYARVSTYGQTLDAQLDQRVAVFGH